jgi:quercetin dioxygenase-like cupin family protein
MNQPNQENTLTFNLLVAGNETGGRFALVDVHEMPGSELPLHIHRNEDEFIYIFSGELTVAIGGERHSAGPGASYFLPRGIEHGSAVTSDEARLLIALIPGGLETFLQAARTRGNEVEIERLIADAAHYGLEITGVMRPAARSEESVS